MSDRLKIIDGKAVLFVMAAEAEYGPHLEALFTPVMTGVGPVEAYARGALLKLFRTQQPGQRESYAFKSAGRAVGSAFLGLDLLPALFTREAAVWCVAKDVRVPRHELVDHRLRDVIKIKAAGLFGHARVKHDLKQQVP